MDADAQHPDSAADSAPGFTPGFVVWFTGLPGSGKSTLARLVVDELRGELVGRGTELVLLEMDARRKAWFPEPEYSEAERERAYALLAEEAAALAARGRGVVLDGTAHRRAWRDAARAGVAHFAEVYVVCSLEAAMQREAARPRGRVMAGLYAKALERRRTGRECPGLGEVIGVDVPYEEDPRAECRVDNSGPDPIPAARAAAECLRVWFAREGLL